MKFSDENIGAPIIAHFVPNFVAMATQSGVNINDTVKLADPENHTLEP